MDPNHSVYESADLYHDPDPDPTLFLERFFMMLKTLLPNFFSVSDKQIYFKTLLFFLLNLETL